MSEMISVGGGVPQVKDKRGIYDLQDASVAQRVVLVCAGALWIAVVWWLLFGDGIGTAGGWFGWTWYEGDGFRRLCLAVALSIYYLRLLFTWFVFLKRGIRWPEATTVAVWLLCIFLFLSIAGGRNASTSGFWTGIGIVAFLAGSWLNTWAEYERYIWKQDTMHHGQLYTQGLFRFTRHPNYLGDVISYSGLCLIAGVWITMILPLLTCSGFVFVNIPALDQHLRERYGQSFEEYAQRTAKLIPFLY